MLDFFTAEELVENYDKFRKLINKTFEGDRLESLNKMYDHFEERMIYTPASSVEHYHNAFPGGYIDHVLRVTRNALKVYDLYSELGGVGDYSKESLNLNNNLKNYSPQPSFSLSTSNVLKSIFPSESFSSCAMEFRLKSFSVRKNLRKETNVEFSV